MTNYKARKNSDGTVSYWSVTRQVRMEHVIYITDADFAALPQNERDTIEGALVAGGAE